jgi:hypothetical protein
VLQSTPRYKIGVHARLPGSPPSLYGLLDTALTDTQSGAVLLSIPTQAFTSPLWFDTTAKRYGIGAVRAANATPVRLDDFLGVSF